MIPGAFNKAEIAICIIVFISLLVGNFYADTYCIGTLEEQENREIVEGWHYDKYGEYSGIHVHMYESYLRQHNLTEKKFPVHIDLFT